MLEMMLNFMLAYISKTKGSAQANPYAELFGVAVATGGPGEDRTPDLRVANVNNPFLRLFVALRKSLYNADLRDFS